MPRRLRCHVDSNGGSDDQKGTSAESAWKSLAKLNSIAFKPGDKILLKAGCTFAGPLRPNGSGAKGKPIVIDRYKPPLTTTAAR